MAVKRVYGKVNGIEVILSKAQGDKWEVPIPADRDGEYVVEILAEDDACNLGYLARILYTVREGNICIRLLPLPEYLFQFEQDPYLFELVCPVCKEVIL